MNAKAALLMQLADTQARLAMMAEDVNRHVSAGSDYASLAANQDRIERNMMVLVMETGRLLTAMAEAGSSVDLQPNAADDIMVVLADAIVDQRFEAWKQTKAYADEAYREVA